MTTPQFAALARGPHCGERAEVQSHHPKRVALAWMIAHLMNHRELDFWTTRQTLHISLRTYNRYIHDLRRAGLMLDAPAAGKGRVKTDRPGHYRFLTFNKYVV